MTSNSLEVRSTDDNTTADHYEKISLKNSAVEQLRETVREMTVENLGQRVTLSQALIQLVAAYRLNKTFGLEP